MLNFDSNHTAIEGNLNQKKGKHSLKNMVVAGLLITNILTFTLLFVKNNVNFKK